jgi:hypothetical protein
MDMALLPSDLIRMEMVFLMAWKTTMETGISI